jgi:hypothetical protein
VRATAEDDDGEQLVGIADASVTIPSVSPSMEVVKLATPREVTEPGGEVTYGIRVYNTSNTESITVTTLVDDLYGDLFTKSTCVQPSRSALLEPGEYFLCAFREQVTGQPGDGITDTVTATVDSASGVLEDSNTAQVEIMDVASSIEVKQLASPTELPEPGGTFRFLVQIQNQSPVDSVTINQIVDDIYGDVATIAGSS